jgi:hypothetical protein
MISTVVKIALALIPAPLEEGWTSWAFLTKKRKQG